MTRQADNRTVLARRALQARRVTGISRLIGDCETLARVTGESHSTARTRLECELGAELATRLVCALARRPMAA